MQQDNSRTQYQTMPSSSVPVYIGEPAAFNEKEIRSKFVSKVYGILSVQLLITLAIVAICIFPHDIRQHLFKYGQVYSLCAFGLAFVVLIILSCFESARRSYPINLVLLFLLTLAYSVIAGTLSAMYAKQEVMLAIGATALATFTIMLIAKYSPFDITTCGCAIFVLSIVHIIFTIVIVIVFSANGNYSTGNLILAGVGSLVVSIYLMFDLQLIMGGRSQEISPEDYILACVMLYVDIITLFQYLLILIGNRRG